LLGPAADRDFYRGVLDDVVVIAAGDVAVFPEHAELVPDGGRIPATVAGIAELRDQLERDPLPGPADPERWVRLLDALGLVDGPVDRVVLPCVGGIVLCPHIMDSL